MRSYLDARREKEQAIEEQRFEDAARLRAEEHDLAIEHGVADRCDDCGSIAWTPARDLAGHSFCDPCAPKHGLFPAEHLTGGEH